MSSWKQSFGELAGKPVETLGKAVRDVMRRGVLTCQLDTPVDQIARLMATSRGDVIAVVDVDGEAVGMIADVDVAGAYAGEITSATAERIMQPKAQVVAPDTLVIEAVHIMRDRGVRQLLIKGEPLREVPVGVVSAMDIVRDMAGLPPERPEPRRRSSKGQS